MTSRWWRRTQSAAPLLVIITFVGCGTGEVTLVPAPRPSAESTPTASPGPGMSPVPIVSPTPSASPNDGGTISIAVPTPGPLFCSPSPIVLTVQTIVIVACMEQGSVAPVNAIVVDPTIASIQISPVPAPNSFGTTFFLTALRTGTTTLALSNAIGVSGSVAVEVTP